MTDDRPAGLTRRDFTLAALGLLAACSRVAGKGTDDDTDVPGDDTDSTDLTGETGTTAWATGGTAVMAAEYADPFTSASTCELTCELTLGPCYADTEERRDISEGISGLPVRLSFKVVDADCNPVPSAVVDIWHASPEGLYSGAEAAEMCTTGDAEAIASSWFRGTQTADSAGRVDFHTCFPGWYSGRTVHIHLQVRVGGDAYVTSQLFFDQALIAEIFSEHPEYKGYGQPDTTNTNDNVLGGEDAAAYTLETRRMADGVMQAYKTLVIRASLSDDSCGSAGGRPG